MQVISEYANLKANIGKEVVLEGVMGMQKVKDKRGRFIDSYELWLKMDSGMVQLRNGAGPISKEPITQKVHIKGTLNYGSIDSDNPDVQSRLGFWLVFTQIDMLERY